jgi:hypothetical protein
MKSKSTPRAKVAWSATAKSRPHAGRLPGAGHRFRDVNDPASRVAKLKAEQLNYSLLAELNTRPRTTYLAALQP